MSDEHKTTDPLRRSMMRELRYKRGRPRLRRWLFQPLRVVLSAKAFTDRRRCR